MLIPCRLENNISMSLGARMHTLMGLKEHLNGSSIEFKTMMKSIVYKKRKLNLQKRVLRQPNFL